MEKKNIFLFWLPNTISLSRLFLAPWVVTAMLNGRYDLALKIYLALWFSDILDGALARTFQLNSLLGSVLDPVSDKISVLILFVGLMCVRLCPIWFIALLFTSYLIQLIGAAGIYLFHTTHFTLKMAELERVGDGLYKKISLPTSFRPLLIGKINMACQFIALFILFFMMTRGDIQTQSDLEPNYLTGYLVSYTFLGGIQLFSLLQYILLQKNALLEAFKSPHSQVLS